ncbi:hypothetical protein EYZ11_012563 [Aspergillus tanneri]|uniref:NmrA-like domain-containing protein n=1 Tax=Aspergillus tanneri TaxID=1220188 RepID=A0A4S3J5B9_9EURO|nr:uncharacterized protein ATNIH1004_001550 [Aspergillus tanneri]KAA8652645.1 hypothetical protein ATNIH1004_001550 [Aspergillus tanneri]THC87991.1 hypothetical protein EYZ11_012563 [Aspergillus tanneri]
MSTSKVIIFGATGGVGSATARSAQEHGAKVFLAMRNLGKPIPDLSLEQEQAGGFERVRADLTDPDTVREAVVKTGAKLAFIYAVMGSSDKMRPSIAALKSAGIEFVVLLSSSSVEGNPRDISPSDFIAFAHAEVEIALEEIFGTDRFIAVRPGFFASNSLWWKSSIDHGEVKLPYPELKFDWISPQDIGRVCGMLLANGSQGIKGVKIPNFVYLFGPEKLSMKDAIAIIARATGKNIQVTQVDEQEGLHVMVTQHGIPEPVAEYLIKGFREYDKNGGLFNTPVYEQAVGNIEKYTNGQPTMFYQWVEENRRDFGA